MDPWLKAHLERMGRLNNDGVSRRLSGTRCQQCRQVILRALDSDVCGVPVSLDPWETSELGEVLALLDGRRTFDVLPWLSATANSYCVRPRSALVISRRRRHPVYAEHRCGADPLPRTSRPWREPPPDDPPF